MVGRAVHFVLQLAAREFDGEKDSYRMALVTVVATSYVARDAQEFRVADLESRLLLELSKERVLRRLPEADAAAG